MMQAYLAMALLVAALAALAIASAQRWHYPAAAAILEAPAAAGAPRRAAPALGAARRAVGIALYVGAEVTIGSTLILYLSRRPRTLGPPLDMAGAWVANL